MKIEIKVPPVGESVVEAVIGALLQPSGAVVAADSELLELETDKVNQVVYATAAGTVQFTVSVGDKVTVGQVIGSIETTATAGAAPPLSKSNEPVQPPAKKTANTPQPSPSPSQMPSVRKMPEEFLAEKDSRAPASASSSAPAESKQVPPKPVAASVTKTDERTSRKKMTKLRRVIAQKLVEVKNQTAMLTTFNEVDMSAVMAVREKEQESFQKRYGIKLGFMSFFIKAAVAALQQYPDINARIEGDEVVYNNLFRYRCSR